MMKKIKVEQLSLEAFDEFGSFKNMINPDTERFGEVPCEFFSDMIQLDLGGKGIASFSICRVEPRENVIETSEYHSCCGEGMLPLDSDCIIHVAPATPPGAYVPVEKIRAFLVPKGTMVTIKPGIWHYAPYAVEDKESNVVIVLPERTYANDCIVVEHKPEDRIQISL